MTPRQPGHQRKDATDEQHPRLGAWPELCVHGPVATLQVALYAGLTQGTHTHHPYSLMIPRARWTRPRAKRGMSGRVRATVWPFEISAGDARRSAYLAWQAAALRTRENGW